MTVLDASAVSALIHNEPGHDVVAERLHGAILGAANLAEVVDKLVDADIDVRRLRVLLSALLESLWNLSLPQTLSSPAPCAHLRGAERCRSVIGVVSP